MLFFNSKTKKKETFIPLTDRWVGMYSCGPTVYNNPHIGNWRAFVFADLVKRALLYTGDRYKVRHIMNITDVDDKTIAGSHKVGKSLKEFTRGYTKAFFKDLTALNIMPADNYPRATKHINEMVDMIETLIEKKHAYFGNDGSVYFKIHTFDDYGQLSGVEVTDRGDQQSLSSADEYTKDDVRDFALWKAWVPEDGDVFWHTNLGKGRPGWHIECSVMSTQELGNHFDIHTGGVDLKFPHHDNEIAQSVCCNGGEFVNYWLHNEHILVDGKKMSKSLGNFHTLEDIKKKGFFPLSYRYFLLQAHYRSQVNFTWQALGAAQTALGKLHKIKKPNFLRLLFAKVHSGYKNKFSEAINNDLDTPRALAIMWELIKDEGVGSAVRWKTLKYFDQVLGLGLGKLKLADDTIKIKKLPKEVRDLITSRATARAAGNWGKSDQLRDEIRQHGFEIQDTEQGQQITSYTAEARDN